ncbi:serine hydroxymethyltransferase, partial [Aerococcus sp. L_4]
VVTSTTHKTLRGPRGGLILSAHEEYAKKINSAIFPGIQGGPLEHVIAAKAVAFGEALAPEFKDYQAQIIKNAKAFEQVFQAEGIPMVSGGTDNHMLLLKVIDFGVTGAQIETALDEVGITVNKNTIPNESLSPFKTSGIRIGTPAITTRGFKESEAEKVAQLIAKVIKNYGNEEVYTEVREAVKELTSQFVLK